MTLSVIVVTYNSDAVLEHCVRAIRSTLPEAEVVIVDNSSADGTTRLCERLDGINLLANDCNSGYGRACNQGARAASGSHLLFLNPDVQIVQADLHVLERELRGSQFGLVAPTLQWSARGTRTVRHWTFDLFSHVLGPLWPRELPELPQLVVRRRNWWPAGALLMVNRAEFLSVGGFDRRFFLYYEDLDLARRYRAAGLPIRATATVRGHHRGGTSSAGDTAAAAVRQGWSYLSWIEYLCAWYGWDTAIRAARSAEALRALVDRALGLLARTGVASERARRKRLELAAVEQFVRAHSTSSDAADFCPQARAIVRSLREHVRS